MNAAAKPFTNREKIIEDVLSERLRQIYAEGYSRDHDNEHVDGELALAAASFAILSTFEKQPLLSHAYSIWPWSNTKPMKKTRRHDLVRAAALIIAELERLDATEEEVPA